MRKSMYSTSNSYEQYIIWTTFPRDQFDPIESRRLLQ